MSWHKKKYNVHVVDFQARPMTRYLPIRKEEFDLRSHIESSGHSLDTCYHVILTEKMCKGYLVKMGGKIKSWKKRWFVFDRLKRTFSYYAGMCTAASPSNILLTVHYANAARWMCRYAFVPGVGERNEGRTKSGWIQQWGDTDN